MDKIIMPRKDGPDFTRDVEDSNKVSDGYHTFGELYDHRISLFIALCKAKQDFRYHGDPRNQFGDEKIVWRSFNHSDGSHWKGWFIMGIGRDKGKQITYHLPMANWDECKFAESLEKAPKFDGHTSADVLERLKNL
jgi:hypothetical protein